MKDHRPEPVSAPSTIGRVLLARPHPNLVEIMQEWLRATDLVPVAAHTESDLRGVPVEDLAGAVISAGVLSEVGLPVAGVVKTLRDRDARLPLVIATIADPEAMARSLTRILASLGEFRVLPLRDLEPANLDLGDPTLVVLLTKEDLQDPIRSTKAQLILRRHLRLRRWW